MNIGGREIGPGYPPYIVAEVSGEHCGDFIRCVKLVIAARWAGADAAKLQLYDPVKLAEARGGKDKVLASGLWKGRTLGDLYLEAHTPRVWFPDLFAKAKAIGITLFSSVFDEEGVDYLESLGCPAYKIASPEALNTGLIRKAALTGKPIIISMGKIETPVQRTKAVFAGMESESGLAILHCVAEYPCPLGKINVARFREHLKAAEGLPIDAVGWSDHTPPECGSLAAVDMVRAGATIVERHITLSRADGGPDAAFSLEPHELKQMVQEIRNAAEKG